MNQIYAYFSLVYLYVVVKCVVPLRKSDVFPEIWPLRKVHDEDALQWLLH